MSGQKLVIMAIGSLPPPIGGTTVLFQQLISQLKDKTNFEVLVIDTSRRSRGLKYDLVVLSQAIQHIVRHIRRVEVVSYHGAMRGTVFFGPFLFVLCRLYNKPLVLRKFGGVFEEKLKAYPWLVRFIVNNTVLKSNLILFETKHLVKEFSDTKTRVEWYPNSREVAKVPPSRSECRSIVFVGHVKPSKGIRELITASAGLANVTIHVYGPLSEGIGEDDFDGTGVHYKGVLAPEQVPGVLDQYDALVLPTYHDGEGYPGVILEAYGRGMPVISTRWRSIPEIVDESSGILIEPKDPSQLAAAIRLLANDEALYIRLCQGAWEKAKFYDADIWTQRFEDWCHELAGAQKRSSL